MKMNPQPLIFPSKVKYVVLHTHRNATECGQNDFACISLSEHNTAGEMRASWKSMGSAMKNDL